MWKMSDIIPNSRFAITR